MKRCGDGVVKRCGNAVVIVATRWWCWWWCGVVVPVITALLPLIPSDRPLIETHLLHSDTKLKTTIDFIFFYFFLIPIFLVVSFSTITSTTFTTTTTFTITSTNTTTSFSSFPPFPLPLPASYSFTSSVSFLPLLLPAACEITNCKCCGKITNHTLPHPFPPFLSCPLLLLLRPKFLM